MIDIEEIIDRISDSFDCHKEYYDLSDSLIDDITKALEQQQVENEQLKKEIDCANIVINGYEDEVKQLKKDSEKKQHGLNAVMSLIHNSEGVSGLHLNGDLAPWVELFDDWLIEFNDCFQSLPKPPEGES